MADDLPLYSDSTLRTSLQFADLARFKGFDDRLIWEKADRLIAAMEGASDPAGARAFLEELSKESLLRVHSILFKGRDGAGDLRTTELAPMYRGQDCAPPEFIDQSLERLSEWLHAESFSEIHAIERCALVITRIVDIWPFEFGNLTTAVVFANGVLQADGLTPFYVQPEHRREFEAVVARAMTIETQPLVNAIYNTVKREMQALGK